MVAQRPCRLRELGLVARLEERVSGVGDEPAEQVRAEHRRDHRAVAAAALAGDAAVARIGQRAVRSVDERHDLVTQVGVVPAGPGRVEELRAAVAGPGVDEGDDRGVSPRLREPRVDRLEHRRGERLAVAPHVDLSGHSLDEIDRWIAPIRLVVVARRGVDVERAPMRIAERVAGERLGVDRQLVDAARPSASPRRGKVGQVPSGGLAAQLDGLEPPNGQDRGCGGHDHDRADRDR